MPHLEAFTQFVASQPHDKPINHDDGWTECAVGEYAQTIGVHAFDVADELFDECYDLWAVMSRGGCGRINVQPVDISTYGKLSEYITSILKF